MPSEADAMGATALLALLPPPYNAGSLALLRGYVEFG
jgi:hypothetical protein